MRIGTYYYFPTDPRCLCRSSRLAVISRQTQVCNSSPKILEVALGRTTRLITASVDLTEIPTVTPQGLVSYHTTPAQVPTVACFTPNLQLGSPFRVSLHSWQSTVPSLSLGPLTPLESTICFEARVLIDGICVAYARTPARPSVA
jgi:hypothetical protein